jgi:hypothetical protein
MKLLDLQESLLQIDESSSKEVDGVHILGKLSGQFFVPEGKSRNNRFYSRTLWEKTLANKDLQERLSNRRMFGTISHEQNIDDTALLEGKISHVITKLYIDSNGKGCGEALLLNTPTGRVLNTMLRAGCKLFVSSRADGEYDGETDEGMPIINEDTYKLHSFDVVIEPGFLEANPKITEALNDALKDIKKENIGENEMNIDEKLFNKLMDDNNKLKTDLEKAIDENKKVVAELSTIQATVAEKANENNTVKENLDKITEELKVAKESLEAKEKELTDLNAVLAEYKELGEAKVISETIDKVEKEFKAYKKLGSVEKINLGIDKATSKLESYLELGTVEELTEALNKSDKLSEKLVKEEEEKEIEKVSLELELPKDSVQKFLDKGLSLDDVKELVGVIVTEVEVEDGDIESEVEDDMENEDDDYSVMDDFEKEDNVEDDIENEDGVTFESKSEDKFKRSLSLLESVTGKLKK